MSILVRHPANRTEQHTLDSVSAVHPEVHRAADLLEAFVQVLRDRTEEHARQQLDEWMTMTDGSDVSEPMAFVTKLRQDMGDIAAALELSYSQGQTEGQINRPNLIKRIVHGRAGLDLLRHRVVYAVAANTSVHPC